MANGDLDTAYKELRFLAVSDPRQARLAFCELLDNGGSIVGRLLERISSPGEGRLRQLVANAVRTRPDRTRIEPFLWRWLNVEADEFTKRAILAALEGMDRSALSDVAAKPLPPNIVETYRYAAERLCHRVRNALITPDGVLGRLDLRVATLPLSPERDEVRVLLTQLRDGFRRVSRVVEFDVSDEYFAWRSLDLVAWLKAMHSRYVKDSEAMNLSIGGALLRDRPTIEGNDYLLDTVFWNLWKNAAQAVTGQCEVSLDGSCTSSRVHLMVLDNGPGLTAAQAVNVFHGRYSTKSLGHGQGLLEVHDAVTRLHGTVKLVEVRSGEHRVAIDLPRAGA